MRRYVGTASPLPLCILLTRNTATDAAEKNDRSKGTNRRSACDRCLPFALLPFSLGPFLRDMVCTHTRVRHAKSPTPTPCTQQGKALGETAHQATNTNSKNRLWARRLSELQDWNNSAVHTKHLSVRGDPGYHYAHILCVTHTCTRNKRDKEATTQSYQISPHTTHTQTHRNVQTQTPT